MRQEESLEFYVKDLLNQIAIKLENVQEPELDEDYEGREGWNSLANFKDGTNWLQSLKILIKVALKDADKENACETEKLARAYYSSFCNG